MRDGRCFPHRADAWTMSNDLDLTSKSGWVLRFGLLVECECTRMVKVEDNALLGVTPVHPRWPPANALEPKSRNAVSALVVPVLK